MSGKCISATAVLATLVLGVVTYTQSGRGGASPVNPAYIARIVWYTRDGQRQPSFIEAGPYIQVEMSPDDAHAVVERGTTGNAIIDAEQERFDLWLADLTSKTFTRWASSADNARDPVWSPDSRCVTYRATGGKRLDLRQICIGSRAESILYTSNTTQFPDDWSPDGKFLLYHTHEPDTVATIPFAEPRQPKVILNAPGEHNSMRVSPNGKWIAYGSNESGKWAVYLASFPSFEGKRQISKDGAVQPRWRRDGRELYYLTSDSRLMAQAVDPKYGKEIGSPKVLFRISAPAIPQVYLYNVTKKGDRFLVTEFEAQASDRK